MSDIDLMHIVSTYIPPLHTHAQRGTRLHPQVGWGESPFWLRAVVGVGFPSVKKPTGGEKMMRITMTEMAEENKYLAEHPDVMAKELYWQGKVMPKEDEVPFADLGPREALDVVLHGGRLEQGPRGKRGPGGQSA